MSGLSSITSASHTAIDALNRLSEQVGAIAENIADGSDTGDLAASLSQLPAVSVEVQSNLFVLQKVQELSQDLILQPRR